MSDERFDKLIKKQLKSVKPPMQPGAWKNFRHLLPVPWYVALFREYGNWMYGGLSTLAVLTTSYLYVQEHKEKEQLHEEITTLKNQVAEQNISTAPKTKNSTAVISDSNQAIRNNNPAQNLRSDTVYLVRKDFVNKPAQNKKNSQQQAAPELIERPAPAPNNTDNVSKRINAKADKLHENVLNEFVTIDNPSTNKVPGGDTNNASKPVTAADQAQPSKLDSTKADSLKLVKNTPPNADSASVTKKSGKEEKNILLPNIHARVGLTFDFLGLDKFSFGPGIELFLSERFSFNTGINISNPEKEQHRDPRDFNRVKGKRFEDMYRNRIPPNDRIEGIGLRTTVLRLPLALNYYLPVNNNFSVLFTGGTNLDLSVNQEVNFQSIPPGGEAEFNKFRERPQPNTFNNLFYGIGLQYQRGRLAGQIIPYYNYQFVNPEYYNPASKIGINATLKFNLKKAESTP